MTEKGKGFATAEKSPDKYHGVGKFNAKTGELVKSRPKAPSYTNVFAKALIAEAHKDSRIVAITGAMPSGTGLDKFGAVFPERTFDVGIAEQHAVTFAAGLAAEGMKPFATIYSTFLQRAFDQIVHDVAIQNLPVRFAIDRAGYVGADGQTHCGAFDIAYLGCLPNLVVMAPSDESELVHMVATAAVFDDHPCAFRYPRGEGTGVELPEKGEVLEIGRGRVVLEGARIALLSYGSCLASCIQAAEKLKALRLEPTVADARFAKPVDRNLVIQLAREHEAVVTVEEGSIGGFAAQVTRVLVENGLFDDGLKFRTIHMPDAFLDHDTPSIQREIAGLNAENIVTVALNSLGIEDMAAAARK